MKTTIGKLIYTTICCYIISLSAMHAQAVDNENRYTVTLSDGTAVVLLGKAISLSDDTSNEFYYLPFSLRLAENKAKDPEFLFLKYMTNEKEVNGGIGGALLHMLMMWGPTAAQRTELETILEKGEQHVPKGSKLKGALEVMPDGEKSLKIISATLGDEKLTRSIVQSFNAPVLEGGRCAVASSLTPQGAQLLAATFEKNMAITDLSVELGYKYTTRIPAAKGKVTINWSKIKSHMDSIHAKYEVDIKRKKRLHFNGFWLSTKTDTKVTRNYDESRSVIDSLIKDKLIEIDFDENVVDDRVTKVREAFFDFFLQKMTQSDEAQELPPPTEKEAEAMPNIKYGREYTFNKKYIESKYESGVETFNLNYRLAVEKPFTITANLASWYNSVKDNNKCVASVLLDDPFFQHRDINFILDNEAKDLLEKGEANYATVSIKKERNSGNDFIDAVTIDYEYLKEKGLKAAITYARGEDKNSDVYKYKIQWSLKGGNVYPANPEWVEGDWQGITLAPPVVSRDIEFEADLEELKALKVARATLQLRYFKFGNEVEKNIPITVSKGEPLVEKTIFTDRDTQGYMYRYILTHKEKGKMVVPPTKWEEKVNDDYVYATIPQELKDEDPDYLDMAVKAGEALLKPGKNGKVTKAAQILDKFKDVLKVVKTD